MKKEFKLIDGKVWVSNSEIKIKINRFSKKEFIYHGKRTLIGLTILFVYRYFLKEPLSDSQTWNYISDSWGWLGLALLISVFIYAIFFHIWRNTIQINDIEKIEVDTLIKQVDVTINMNNKRYKILEFDIDDKHHNNFVELLKKRNTRIKIEQ